MLRITAHLLCEHPVAAQLHQEAGHQQVTGRQRLLTKLYALWAESLIPGLVTHGLLPEVKDLEIQPGSSASLRCASIYIPPTTHSHVLAWGLVHHLLCMIEWHSLTASYMRVGKRSFGHHAQLIGLLMLKMTTHPSSQPPVGQMQTQVCQSKEFEQPVSFCDVRNQEFAICLCWKCLDRSWGACG